LIILKQDKSRNHESLLALADEVCIPDRLFWVLKPNQTENRAVLHTALRARENQVVKVNGVNVIPEIY
jgi:glucose-6-phosphate isomerase